ncbi:MAG: hypothetical protein IJU76_01950 [Desulfovibrionaceae bacterium]|nr:hypothetical protein [Desulfovibrionaceae bacterium]
MIIPVNIVKTYPVHWDEYNILRDFIQNFYDAVGYRKFNESFHYSFENNTISMWIKDISFSFEWLLHIGASTKTLNSKNNAGYFGEGFKIASLCAARDYDWNIHMASGDWNFKVQFIDHSIDNQIVEMMAYDLNKVETPSDTTILTVSPCYEDTFELFKTVLISFYYPENPLFGEKLWEGSEGAVYLRSNTPIPELLPCTKDNGRKGAVFCGYQMLGTNPFDLVLCLHAYKKNDRERKTLYAFDVVDVFEELAYYCSAKCAMVMLEKMRRFWSSYQRKRIDIYSLSTTIDLLVEKISRDDEIRKLFTEKYPNILCIKKVMNIEERNMRVEARSWLEKQGEKKYILAKKTFMNLGYITLEECCRQNDGFVRAGKVIEMKYQRCFDILFEVSKDVFADFFILDSRPECKIITNTTACYSGMASLIKRTPVKNKLGIAVRYGIQIIYLHIEDLKIHLFFKALSVFIHELCHMFGGDSSKNFSYALSEAITILLYNKEPIDAANKKWIENFIHYEGGQSKENT